MYLTLRVEGMYLARKSTISVVKWTLSITAARSYAQGATIVGANASSDETPPPQPPPRGQ